ncbi:tetratricopeptide repeat protein [Pelagimonas sp. KU-00592-HH]|uniref:tetratricopeptide repeat protein n=1 Tax=Pelagimonas sp. KU-00592-HH TaxID=3127651 RepID=UPI003109B5EF
MSASSQSSGAQYDVAIAELALWRNPIHILDEATENDPEFVMGHIFKAHMDMVSTDRRYSDIATGRLKTISRLIASKNCQPREKAHFEALKLWHSGDWFAASRALDQLQNDFPTDMLALWMGHQLDFYLGESNNIRDRIARALPMWDKNHPLYSLVEGMYAFGLEEAGESEKAKDIGLQALEKDCRDVWSIHAVAHAVEMLGDFNYGADFMENRIQDWTSDNFLTSHNAIHTILYRLEQGDLERCIFHFDSFVLPENGKPALLGLVDGSSALWRLFLDGIDTGDRWATLASQWEPTAEQAFYAFNDVHAMMAFVASGNSDATHRMLKALETYLANDANRSETNYAVTAEVGLPICCALQAFGAGKYTEVLDGLVPIRDQIIRFGGSHAQRDVIERTILEAAIRANAKTLADNLIHQRLSKRPNSTYNLQNRDRVAQMH